MCSHVLSDQTMEILSETKKKKKNLRTISLSLSAEGAKSQRREMKPPQQAEGLRVDSSCWEYAKFVLVAAQVWTHLASGYCDDKMCEQQRRGSDSGIQRAQRSMSVQRASPV